jgi:hypothetical protein
MNPIKFATLEQDGEVYLTALVPGHGLKSAQPTHPNFKLIVEKLARQSLDGPLSPEEAVGLFDPATGVAAKFERLSNRITARNGAIYLDGSEVNNAITEQILRFMEVGEDFEPLVNFFEKLLANPNEHSREQLYRWLQAAKLTITPEGLIVGYKGVSGPAEEGGPYRSVMSGEEVVLVDGEEVTGQVPQPIGAIIEMKRDDVKHDPRVGCAPGLHVGTFDYASTWTTVSAVLEVHVDPVDVVSVPTDSSDQKMRVRQYQVIGVIEKAHEAPVLRPPTIDLDEPDFEDDENECYACGADAEDCICDDEDDYRW